MSNSPSQPVLSPALSPYEDESRLMSIAPAGIYEGEVSESEAGVCEDPGEIAAESLPPEEHQPSVSESFATVEPNNVHRAIKTEPRRLDRNVWGDPSNYTDQIMAAAEARHNTTGEVPEVLVLRGIENEALGMSMPLDEGSEVVVRLERATGRQNVGGQRFVSVHSVGLEDAHAGRSEVIAVDERRLERRAFAAAEPLQNEHANDGVLHMDPIEFVVDQTESSGPVVYRSATVPAQEPVAAHEHCAYCPQENGLAEAPVPGPEAGEENSGSVVAVVGEQTAPVEVVRVGPDPETSRQETQAVVAVSAEPDAGESTLPQRGIADETVGPPVAYAATAPKASTSEDPARVSSVVVPGNIKGPANSRQKRGFSSPAPTYRDDGEIRGAVVAGVTGSVNEQDHSAPAKTNGTPGVVSEADTGTSKTENVSEARGQETTNPSTSRRGNADRHVIAVAGRRDEENAAKQNEAIASANKAAGEVDPREAARAHFWSLPGNQQTSGGRQVLNDGDTALAVGRLDGELNAVHARSDLEGGFGDGQNDTGEIAKLVASAADETGSAEEFPAEIDDSAVTHFSQDVAV